MSSQKVGSIKIPPFDKENYSLWKKKMTLFIKAANPLYMGIMENGPFVPHKMIHESVTDTGERIPQKFVPKEIVRIQRNGKRQSGFRYKSPTDYSRFIGHCNVEPGDQLQ